jgi:hypothetical protein
MFCSEIHRFLHLPRRSGTGTLHSQQTHRNLERSKLERRFRKSDNHEKAIETKRSLGRVVCSVRVAEDCCCVASSAAGHLSDVFVKFRIGLGIEGCISAVSFDYLKLLIVDV